MKLVISDLKANIFMIENHNRIANRNSVFDGLTNIIEPEFFICISYEPSDSFFSKLLNCEGTGELIDVKMFFTSNGKLSKDYILGSFFIRETSSNPNNYVSMMASGQTTYMDGGK